MKAQLEDISRKGERERKLVEELVNIESKNNVQGFIKVLSCFSQSQVKLITDGDISKKNLRIAQQIFAWTTGFVQTYMTLVLKCGSQFIEDPKDNFSYFFTYIILFLIPVMLFAMITRLNLSIKYFD